MKEHVLLIYPSCEKDNPNMDSDFAEGWRNIPIGILSIGTFIKQKGYDVDIVDCRRYSKSETISVISSKIKKETICVGLSMMTMQISHGLVLIDFIKSKYNIPVVVGGIHATLFSTQTIQEKKVDYVISGEGEFAFLSLLNYLTNNTKPSKDKRFLKKSNADHKLLDNISGLSYKIENKIFENKVGTPLDVSVLPFPDYDLLDNIEMYIKRKFMRSDGSYFNTRTLDIHTSRGCPYQCTFCINTLACFKKWRSKKIEDILNYIDHIVLKYKIDFLWFMDDFFFGDIKRVRVIAQHLIDKKYSLKWEATIRANLFNPKLVNDDVLFLMKKSGCYSLGFGFESGSERILKKIHKAITINEIIYSVEQCKKYNIMPRGSFMCGFPTETKDEVKATGRLVLKLKSIYPKGIFYSPGLLRPYPGAELYKECLLYGFLEPKTLREWSTKNFNFGLYMSAKDLKWIKYPNWIRNYQVYLHLAALRLSAKLLKTSQSIPYKLFGEISLFRIKHDLFLLPIEPTVLIFFNNLSRK